MNSPYSSLAEVFMPHAADATQRVIANGCRFAYYTTAETAFRILSNRTVWMRSTRTMNDFMEIEHGVECVAAACKSESGRKLAAAIDGLFPGLFDEVLVRYRAWVPGFQSDTFVTCVSEHVSADDLYGRLSMWRAYGGRSGVALVLNGGVMFSQTDALAAYSSPVAYFDYKGVAEQMGLVADRVLESSKLIMSTPRDDVLAHLFQMLRYGSICTKHPGFEEEREWRIVSSPSFQESELLPQSIEIIGGVPQTVLKLPLRDDPERGLVGLEISSLLERVIIGPTEFPSVLRRAFSQQLRDRGVSNPLERIFVSNIPLREVQK